MSFSEIVIPKVFKEANFDSSKDLLKRRSLSRVCFKERTVPERKVRTRPFITKEAGIPVDQLPFRVDGFVIHTYAIPSRKVTEFKEQAKPEESFNKDIKKIMNRFESNKFSRYVPKDERTGFQGWKRSQVFIQVVQKKGNGKGLK